MIGISALRRVIRELASSLLAVMWGHSRKTAVCNPEESLHQDPTFPAPWSWTSRKHSFLLFMSPSSAVFCYSCLNRLREPLSSPHHRSLSLFQAWTLWRNVGELQWWGDMEALMRGWAGLFRQLKVRLFLYPTVTRKHIEPSGNVGWSAE